MFWLGIAVCMTAVVGIWIGPRITRSAFSRTRPEADLPCAFGYKMAWVAVKTRDTARLIEALGLDDVRLVSWSVGVGTIYNDRVGLNRVFVTPPVDGWSLVAGLSLPHPMSDAFEDKCSPLLTELSREFGQVQYYVSFPVLEFFGWAVLRDGRMHRAFACGPEGVVWNRGAITADERVLDMPMFELCEVDPSDDVTGKAAISEKDVLDLARRWSLDPTRLDTIDDAEFGVGYVAMAPSEWRASVVAQQAA